MTANNVLFIEADEAIKRRVLNEWGEKAAHHMHLTDGFSIVALHGEILVGLISIYWRDLPEPLKGEFDGLRSLPRNGISERGGGKRLLRR